MPVPFLQTSLSSHFRCEGIAVGTFNLRGIGFMRSDIDLGQCAVILTLAVMDTLLYGTADATVGLLLHFGFTSLSGLEILYPAVLEFIRAHAAK